MSTMELLGRSKKSSSTETGRVTFKNAIPCQPLKFDRNKIETISQKQVDAAKKALKEEYDTFSYVGNSIISTNGWETYSRQTGNACHKFIERVPRDALKYAFATENGCRRKVKQPGYGAEANAQKNRPQAADALLSWFLYYSPYGEFVMNRDDYEFCRNYGFVINPTIPHPIFMNMLIITRHFYEIHINALEKYTELTTRKDNPIDPTIAWSLIINTMFSAYGNTQLDKQFQGYSGHRAGAAWSPHTFVNIFNGEPGTYVDMKKTMWDKQTVYGSLTLFHPSRKEPFLTNWVVNDDDIRQFIREQRRKTAGPVKYTPPDPFAPRVPEKITPANLPSYEFTYTELYDYLIPYYEQRVREELSTREELAKG